MSKPYADPYLSGIALGLVLLAAFVFVGRGIGASGAFASVAATTVNAVAPSAVRGNAFLADHLGALWNDWLVVEVAGVFVGGFISAALAGRLRFTIELGTRDTPRGRLVAAMSGGAVMGVGAVLARGCTSGQALTGGALLSVGSWVFIAGAFAAAYAASWMRRGLWT